MRASKQAASRHRPSAPKQIRRPVMTVARKSKQMVPYEGVESDEMPEGDTVQYRAGGAVRGAKSKKRLDRSGGGAGRHKTLTVVVGIEPHHGGPRGRHE